MLGTIILREMQEYSKSMRLWIGLFAALLLTTVSTVINIGEYQRKNAEYNDAIQNVKGVAEILLFRSPQALSILVQGESDHLGNRFSLEDYSIPVRASDGGKVSGRMERHFFGFEAFDFTFTVKVALSLVVIFLAYGSIAEEKASGTLRLSLANSVPRHLLITGKFIGGLAVVFFALLAAWTVSLLLMLLHPGVAFGPDILPRATVILALAALCLGTFYSLGLWISVIAGRPSNALMILLQIWVFIVILYPNTAMLATQRLVRIPGEKEITERRQALSDIYRNKPKLYIEWAERLYRIDSDFDLALKKQVRAGEILAGISPSSLFTRAATRLARTGTAEYERFIEGIYRYWSDNLKTGKISSRRVVRDDTPPFQYQTEPFSHSLAGIAWESAVLFLWGLLFFTLSVFAFLRKDAR